MKVINTHNLIIEFGKHRGERWTRVPVSYLRFLVNEGTGERKDIAEAELKRRGTTILNDLELSGHSIDRASQITDEWKESGVYSWLATIATEALDHVVDSEKVHHKGYIFAFAFGNHFPILKTIMRDKNENKR